jgi:aspartyl/glutamyl-tRNA(Asn/Gln) amidotransferase C subunit
MEFQDEDIKKLAALSRIELTPQEISLFRDQLTSVLSYVVQSAEAQTTESFPETDESKMRLDEVRPSEATRDALIAAAPVTEEGHISVHSVK